MLRINFFAAWMAVLAAEMVGVKNGLGMMIILGREMFNTKLILLGMCMVGATGYVGRCAAGADPTQDPVVAARAMKTGSTTLACQHVGKLWPA